jgi:hypothetical protein
MRILGGAAATPNRLTAQADAHAMVIEKHA